MPELSLVPVDHNPFEQDQTASYDPFAAEKFANPAVDSLLSGAAKLVSTPGHLANTPNPYPPGSEEAQFFEDSRAKAGSDWVRDAALSTMGTGAIAGVPVRAGEAVVGAGPIRAYHGSPHDFDAFSLDKIGTGEGAQAYGHGLYFAENPAVAGGYRDTLAGDTLVTPKGTVFDPMTLEHMNVRSRAHSNGSNLDATIETAQKIAASDSPVADMAKRDLDRLLALKAEGGVSRNKGKMYEVQINADPEHFLDWDKPLSEQPQHINEAAQKVFKIPQEPADIAQLSNGRWATVDKNGNVVGRQDGWPDPSIARDVLKENARFSQEQLTKPVGDLMSRRYAGQTKEDFSQALREVGIPGIKYLDQGSRGAGEGSRNYVVFDDKLIDIIKKYGMAGMSMLPPATAAFLSQRIRPVDHDPFDAGAGVLRPVDHDPFVARM